MSNCVTSLFCFFCFFQCATFTNHSWLLQSELLATYKVKLAMHFKQTKWVRLPVSWDGTSCSAVASVGARSKNACWQLGHSLYVPCSWGVNLVCVPHAPPRPTIPNHTMLRDLTQSQRNDLPPSSSFTSSEVKTCHNWSWCWPTWARDLTCNFDPLLHFHQKLPT